MKIIVTLLSLALATGALFSSCSKTELGEVTPPETKVPGEDEISPRFTSNNLTYAEAIDFVQPFLEREPEFRFAKIFDREPGYYIQYNGLYYKIVEVKYNFETGWLAVVGCESSEMGE